MRREIAALTVTWPPLPGLVTTSPARRQAIAPMLCAGVASALVWSLAGAITGGAWLAAAFIV